MLKRVITAAVGVVGLVLVGLGVASATLWRADDVLVATASGSAHTYVTDPGVLEMGGDPATVRITVPDGAHVVLAVGRDTDVTGWIGSDPHARVTGLSSWHDLATATASAKPTPAPTAGATAKPSPTPSPTGTAAASAGGAATSAAAADPTGSDMWVQESAGNGSASLTWQAQPGRWSLIAVSTGAAAPTLSISWPRVVTTPWLWPLVVIGLVLVLGAVAMFLWDVRRRRRGPDADWTPVTTGAIPAVEGEPTAVLTRRQLREAAQARAARPRTGATPVVGSPETTPVPATPRADAGESTQPTSAPSSNRPGAPASTASPAAVTARPGDPSTAAPVGQDDGAGTSAPATGPIPTSRRALRAAGAATGATPAVAPRPVGAHEAPTAVQPPVQAAGGRAAAAGTAGGPATPRTPGTTPPAPAGAAPTPTPGATSPAPAGAAPSPMRGATSPAPAGATGRTTSVPGARSNGADAPTTPAPADAPTAATGPVEPPHHARPTWLPVPPDAGQASPATGPQATPATGPASATHHPRWLGTHTGPDAGPPASPVLPPPGPQRGAGDTGDEPDTGGSRADAWRRAWGLPPVDRDDATDGEGRNDR
ncbi:hypothetical protein [Cellulomonas alba]|uniref:Uncharacterized protein n=1 Tax=Cellulomonas alba TaxID=3053467 RepID=A0ABT7SHX7_9CELL|nr:hypothetical protein [Cellulomonas alba]MDM7855792.1 hypothetical protein [Cellulomonas alba]